ncbi:MAG: hypothetical protein IKJ43_04065 [Bacilli bacterium]|nr:hypothetical protein [Bacilli bacterium]
MKSRNERNLKIVTTLIERIKDRIQDGKSIKKDLFYLEEIYKYLLAEDCGYKEIIIMIDEVLLEFRNYMEEYSMIKKNERKQRQLNQLKLEKIDEYKAIWDQKSKLFHLLHRDKNPSKVVDDDVDINTIENSINSLKGKKA